MSQRGGGRELIKHAPDEVAAAEQAQSLAPLPDFPTNWGHRRVVAGGAGGGAGGLALPGVASAARWVPVGTVLRI
jgi:hypothetical protein